jgi:hypothetical protein
VCLELKQGPIESALRADDFLVLFPVNPRTVAQYREALTPIPGSPWALSRRHHDPHCGDQARGGADHG